MEKVYLQWNFPNWISVLLMVALGGVLIGTISSGLQTFSDSANG